MKKEGKSKKESELKNKEEKSELKDKEKKSELEKVFDTQKIIENNIIHGFLKIKPNAPTVLKEINTFQNNLEIELAKVSIKKDENKDQLKYIKESKEEEKYTSESKYFSPTQNTDFSAIESFPVTMPTNEIRNIHMGVGVDFPINPELKKSKQEYIVFKEPLEQGTDIIAAKKRIKGQYKIGVN
jgi:hypothetical protein